MFLHQIPIQIRFSICILDEQCQRKLFYCIGERFKGLYQTFVRMLCYIDFSSLKTYLFLPF